MKSLIAVLLFLGAVLAAPQQPRRPMTYGLENRDFFTPKNNLSWKRLSQELTKDRIKKQTSNFVYKKGTKQFDDICGLENTGGSGKIVGGQEAKPNQFPWLVALFANSWFCSASLISDEWVLTAAHCVDGATSWRVFAGSHDISLDEEPHRVIVATNESIVHPDWNPFTVANDIALIKLPEKIEFNEFIRPSCLPSYTYAHDNLANLFVTATGWGKLSDASTTKSDRLNYAPNLRVMSNTECHNVYGMITDGQICIDTEGGHGVCNGDSGGPLNIQRSAGKYTTVGVASFVSSFGCESGLPHAFTRVGEYLSWIESETGIMINP